VEFADLVEPTAPPTSEDLPDAFSGLPTFLRHNSKITMDYNGSYQKGFLQYSPEAGFSFTVKRNLRSSKVDTRVPLPDFRQSWSTLVGENVILPGHTSISSFLRPNSSNNAPFAQFVSAKNLLNPCPPSLVKALHPTNPDHDAWLKSYHEEKGGLQNLEVFERINKKTYLHLRCSGRIG
jgi:hypothetical protein